MTRYFNTKEVDVGYVAALRRLESRSPWTMTTGVDTFGAYFVSFVIREFSGRVTLKFLSKRQLTSAILLLDESWEEMSSLLDDLERKGHLVNVVVSGGV
jgi:hypothetical protein